MDLQKEIFKVEKKLMQIIVDHLKANKIALPQAQQLARDFLALLPFADQKDLLLKLQKLSNSYEEAKTVYVEELASYNEEKKNVVLTQMRNHIMQGQIDDAIRVAKLAYS